MNKTLSYIIRPKVQILKHPGGDWSVPNVFKVRWPLHPCAGAIIPVKALWTDIILIEKFWSWG